MSLLTRDAVLEAAHDLWCVFVNDRWDEIGRKRAREYPPFRAMVKPLPKATQLETMWRVIGRVEQAWGYDVGLVFHHAGIEQATGLYYLIMGCLGHGVSLADDYGDNLDKAAHILGKRFDTHPIDCEGTDWFDLAEERYAGVIY